MIPQVFDFARHVITLMVRNVQTITPWSGTLPEVVNNGVHDLDK